MFGFGIWKLFPLHVRTAERNKKGGEREREFYFCERKKCFPAYKCIFPNIILQTRAQTFVHVGVFCFSFLLCSVDVFLRVFLTPCQRHYGGHFHFACFFFYPISEWWWGWWRWVKNFVVKKNTHTHTKRANVWLNKNLILLLDRQASSGNAFVCCLKVLSVFKSVNDH